MALYCRGWPALIKWPIVGKFHCADSTQGVSECYECQPKPAAKTYPGCTIRNTPSEPIHCIVWAKHLFNQLFGEPDADNDVSPETEKEEGVESGEGGGEDGLHVQRISTRQWAENNDYNPKKLFHKVRVKRLF